MKYLPVSLFHVIPAKYCIGSQSKLGGQFLRVLFRGLAATGRRLFRGWRRARRRRWLVHVLDRPQHLIGHSSFKVAVANSSSQHQSRHSKRSDNGTEDRALPTPFVEGISCLKGDIKKRHCLWSVSRQAVKSCSCRRGSCARAPQASQPAHVAVGPRLRVGEFRRSAPICCPSFRARLRPSAVRVRIRSRSTSARPPNTAIIKREVL